MITFATIWAVIWPYLKAILIVLIGHGLIKRYAEKLVLKVTSKMRLTRNLQTIVLIAVKFGLYFVLITSVCPMIGISTTSLVTLLGTVGAAAALAMKDSLSAMVGGVFLMITDAFSVGDWVAAAGIEGTVQKVGFYFTEIMTGDNHLIYVPNSSLTKTTVQNYSRTEKRRLDLDVGVSYAAKLPEARAVIEDICKADSRVFRDPAPFVRTWDLNASSVNIKIRVWCKSSDYWELRSDLQETIKETLDAKGMGLPFNQLDVNLFQQK